MSTRQGFYLFLIILAFVFSGCGTNVFEGIESKDTEEANAFDVSKKLDSGDYKWILDNPDKVNATDYAAAAMGYAGLDSDSLITALNDMADEEKNNNLSAVTSLSIKPDALPYLQEAKKKLENELLANPEDPELNFQMVLTSLTSTITALAQVGQDSVGGFDSTDGISNSEAVALGNYIVTYPGVNVNVDTNNDGLVNANDTLVSLVAGDVSSIETCLPKAQLGSESALNEVLQETTQGEDSIDYNGDGTVTAPDISNYLISILGQ